ncbi:Parathyroid hormone/parathyroid hormone-related peptide receptor [Mactra antiquata]
MSSLSSASILGTKLVSISIDNTMYKCWNTNPTAGYFWLLRAPIVISIVINFIFFINILRALFTKLHKPSTSSARRNRYRRLAKATLILIPLFGVHYIVFIWAPDKVSPEAEVIKLYFEMFFNSFQGFFVAVLFCFFNQEVQMEIKKTWYRLWSKPDPVFLQQSQYLANSGDGARRFRDSRMAHPSDNRVSSDASSGPIEDGCLCKWTLNKNGKITRTFVNTHSLKPLKKNHKKMLKETCM